MMIKKTILASTIAAISLVGCGTQDQDSGSNSSAKGNYAQGVAIDGPVVRGTVFMDLNGNLKKDSFEPSALTDNDGYFNYNAVTKAAYCQSNLSSFVSRPEFCLDLSKATIDTKIIVTGGYDLYTGEPFEGSMTIGGIAQVLTDPVFGGVAITPVSSIFASLFTRAEDYTSDDVLTDLIDSAGGDIDSNLLDPEDPEGDGKADNFKANAFAVSYSMHKFITVYAAWIKRAFPEIGDDDKLPNDVSSLIYKQARLILTGKYSDAWDAIYSDLTTLYGDAGVTLNAAVVSPTVLFTDLVAVNTAIVSAFGNAPELGSDLTFDNVKARVRGVEVVVLKVIRGLDYTAAQAALNDSTYLANLAGNSADNDNLNFTKLVEFEGNSAALVAESALAATASGVSMNDLAGKSLSFEDNDASLTSKAAIFFTGAENGTRGDIHLCLQYEDNSDPDVNLEGDYISGSWETLAALNNTVLLDMNIFGGTSASIKNIGDDGAGGTEYRFDYQNKIAKFTSDQSLEVTADLNLDAIPQTDAACKTYLGITGDSIK